TLAILSIVFGGTVFAQAGTLDNIYSSKTLKVGVNPLFEPFSFEQDGQRVGVDIDIAQELADKLGVELELVVPDNFSDLIPMLQKGDIDIIMAGMSITFDRAKVIDFSDSYFDTGISILLNKVSSSPLGLGSVKDLAEFQSVLNQNNNEDKLIIAVTKGKAPEKAAASLFPKATIKSYASNEEAALATLNGEAHIMMHDEIFLKLFVKNNTGLTRFKAFVLNPPIKADAYGIAVRKSNQDFVNLLNVFIRELNYEGGSNKYLGQYLPVKSNIVIRSIEIDDQDFGD
ncbi:MAG TPA: transporter substrate-binding domain-containing protein, partial [Trueperaceae bacterium]|nr:transporter substrate-binding domain-containing protein [Trueperaceae bacterium]